MDRTRRSTPGDDIVRILLADGADAVVADALVDWWLVVLTRRSAGMGGMGGGMGGGAGGIFNVGKATVAASTRTPRTKSCSKASLDVTRRSARSWSLWTF